MRIKKKRKEVSNSVAGFPYLQERIMKKNMYITILQGMAVTAAFLITEIVLNWLGAFDGAVRLYLVDISLRLIFGTIALVLLADNFKKQRNEHSVKALFTNMISKRTYILLVPFLDVLVDLKSVYCKTFSYIADVWLVYVTRACTTSDEVI